MNTEGYTKLSASILTSTIWMEPNSTRLVWITLLALCDKAGFVSGTIPGLANVARVTLDECAAAITAFLSPDQYSRTKDHEGRRIEEVAGGWRLLNFMAYRAERSADERREYMREYVADYRAAGKDKARPVSQRKPAVNTGKLGKPGLAQAEAEHIHTAPTTPDGMPGSEAEALAMCATVAVSAAFVTEIYLQVSSRGWRDGAGVAVTDWPQHVRSRWVKRQSETAEKAARSTHRGAPLSPATKEKNWRDMTPQELAAHHKAIMKGQK
jgi:hypothetical protein